MKITIAGMPGSGKSTVAKEVAKELNYKLISTGDLRGEVAQERGITIDQLNEINEEWTHRIVDDKIHEIGKQEKNIVFDSWMAWHFVPDSFKIFLDVNSAAAAKRIFKNQRADEKKTESEEETKKMIEQRVKTWSEQIKKFYHVDPFNKQNFDLVIDTTQFTIDEVISKLINKIKERQK